MLYKKSLAYSILNTVFSGALAYAFQLYILTNFNSKYVAEYIVTISVLNIIFAPSSALNLYFTKNYIRPINDLIVLVFYRINYISILTLLITIFGLYVKSNIITSAALVILAYCAALSFIIAYLENNFKYIFTFNFISNASKFIFILLLAFFFDKNYTVIIFAIFLSYCMGIFYAKSYVTAKIKAAEICKCKFDYKVLLYYVSSFICINLISNVDVLYIKYFFDPSYLNDNSKVLLFGKIVFYISTSISTAIFSASIKKITSTTFFNAILFATIIYFSAIILVLILDYLELLNIIGNVYDIIKYIIYTYPISLIFLIENYYLLMNKNTVILSSIFGQTLIVILVLYLDNVNIFLYTLTIINFISAFYLIYGLKKSVNK